MVKLNFAGGGESASHSNVYKEIKEANEDFISPDEFFALKVKYEEKNPAEFKKAFADIKKDGIEIKTTGLIEKKIDKLISEWNNEIAEQGFKTSNLLEKAGQDAEESAETEAKLVAEKKVKERAILTKEYKRRKTSKEEVKKLQELLIEKGYDLGKYGADGDFGRMTRNALNEEKAILKKEMEEQKVDEARDFIDSLDLDKIDKSDKTQVKKIQQALVDSGYRLKGRNKGVDGILGKGTLDALKIEKNSLSASIRRFKKNNFFADFEEIYGMGAISTIDPDQSLQKKITKLKENGLKNPEKSKTEINALYKEFLEKIIYITDLDDNDEVKVLNKVKDYQENGNLYDKIVVLSEFNNASMHSELTGEDGNKINERSSMEKEEKGRLGLFNEGLKTIGINQGDYIRNIFYKKNKNVDKSSSTYHENAVGLTVRDYKGDKGAVNIDAQVPVELVDAKIVNLRKTTKRIKSILSHDINYKHFAEMFIKETGVTPSLNQMVKAIRVGHITLGGKYYKIDSKVFFSKAANCFNDFVGIEMDITPAKKPRKRVHRGPGKRVKHVDTPVIAVEQECTPLQFLNGECGPEDPFPGGGGEGGNGSNSSNPGVGGGGSNGGGGSGGGNDNKGW